MRHLAWFVLICIASLFFAIESSAESCEYKYQVTDRVYYRAIRVMRNETAVLPCWELVDPSKLVFWMVSDNFFIRPGDDTYAPKYSVDSNGSLVIQDSVKRDTGIYKCISESISGGDTLMEAELQVIDTSYIPELDDWISNLVRGLIAAGSTAAFFILCCGIKHFSWHERSKGKLSVPSNESYTLTSDDNRSSSSLSNMKSTTGIDNPAMSMSSDTDEEIESGL